MADFNAFWNEWLGRRVDFDHVSNFQCVDLIKQYVFEEWGIIGEHGDAILYWTNTPSVLLSNFSKIPNSDAQAGDIVVLFPIDSQPRHAAGHIGIATGNLNASDIEILEQNGHTGSGDGLGGNAIRVRYVPRSRVAGLLRPHETPVAPAPAVNPYSVETITSKEVKLNKDTHKWGLNYDNLTAIENNPEGNISAGTVITVKAILHHNIGYKYYLEDPNVASGYNVVDCDDWSAPVPVNPTPVPATGALHPSNSDTYEVIKDIPGYLSSSQALNNVNPKVTIPVGTYFVFNKRDSALNLTKTPGAAGAWVNPADNTFTAPVPEPAPEPTPEPEPVEVQPTFADTYHAFEKPELYVAMRKLQAVDKEVKHKTAFMPQYSVTWITGSFTVDGVEYARPKSATDKGWWYGIAWIDPVTSLVNLELESEVFDSKTTIAERQATNTLKLTDRFLLVAAHLKHYYLGFTQLLSRIKSSSKNK